MADTMADTMAGTLADTMAGTMADTLPDIVMQMKSLHEDTVERSRQKLEPLWGEQRGNRVRHFYSAKLLARGGEVHVVPPLQVARGVACREI
jgi:hypothetical protein